MGKALVRKGVVKREGVGVKRERVAVSGWLRLGVVRMWLGFCWLAAV